MQSDLVEAGENIAQIPQSSASSENLSLAGQPSKYIAHWFINLECCGVY